MSGHRHRKHLPKPHGTTNGPHNCSTEAGDSPSCCDRQLEAERFNEQWIDQHKYRHGCCQPLARVDRSAAPHTEQRDQCHRCRSQDRWFEARDGGKQHENHNCDSDSSPTRQPDQERSCDGNDKNEVLSGNDEQMSKPRLFERFDNCRFTSSIISNHKTVVHGSLLNRQSLRPLANQLPHRLDRNTPKCPSVPRFHFCCYKGHPNMPAQKSFLIGQRP